MIATYHNHTHHSDGSATLSEMVSFAEILGIDELGISDHFCLLPTGETSRISIPLHGLSAYVQEILSFQKEVRPAVRIGIEIDWFERQGDVIRNAVEALPFDYRIGAVHYVEQNEIDKHSAYWQSRTQHERDDVYRMYWDSVREMAETGLFDIAAHLDLPKKFGYYPRADMTRHILDTLKAIARNHLVVELNTAGFGKPCQDGYPSPVILKMCRKLDIPVTLSADAHAPRHLLFEFDKGIDRLKAAGYTEIARFKHRHVRFEPLTSVEMDLEKLGKPPLDGEIEWR